MFDPLMILKDVEYVLAEFIKENDGIQPDESYYVSDKYISNLTDKQLQVEEPLLWILKEVRLAIKEMGEKK